MVPAAAALAAGCNSLQCARHGVTKHPPSPDVVGEAVTAALACSNGGTKDLVAVSAVICSRYMQWAARQFGPHDVAVEKMQRVLDLVAPTATKSGVVEVETGSATVS